MNSRKVITLFLCLLMVLSLSVTEAFGQRDIKKSSQVVMIDNNAYYLHVAKRWQDLNGIALAYEVTPQAIIQSNPKFRGQLKSGDKILIPKIEQKAQIVSTEQIQTPSYIKSPEQIQEQKRKEQDSLMLIEALEYGMTVDRDNIQGLDSIMRVYLNDTTTNIQYPLVEFGKTKPINSALPIEVAVLMPFDQQIRNATRFVSFLNGLLLSVNEISLKGKNINIRVIATDKTPERIKEIIWNGELDGVDMIIGPVYAREFEVAALYSAIYRVPIISPLGSVGRANHPYVVGIAPDNATSLDKILSKFKDIETNVILVDHKTHNDSLEMLKFRAVLPQWTQTLNYVDKHTEVDSLSKLLVRGRENLLVIPSSDESVVEELLSRYGSINATGRYNISTIGLSSWTRFSRIDMDLFFKMGVNIPATYFFDRLSEPMSSFYQNYISSYGSLPTLYSMRGYDVGILCIGLLCEYGEDVMYELIRDTPTPLQVPYLFDQDSDSSYLRNIDWPLVVYNSDYTISLE